MSATDATEGCVEAADAQEVEILALAVVQWSRHLREAWEQDLQKDKHRQHVRWCHDELCAAVAELHEEWDK